MFKTESEFKKMLSELPDHKIKKMTEQIDVYNFPILLLMEYSRRFGPKKDQKEIIRNLSHQLLKEKKERIKILKKIKIHIKNMSDYYITQSGLQNISLKSISTLHQKTKNTTTKLKDAAIQIESLNDEIMRLEKLYKELQS